MCRQVVHDLDHCKTALSEGKALAVVVKAVPGSPHWRRVGTDSPCPLRQSAVGCGPACAGLARRVGGAAREGRKWRERPRVFRRWCATGQGRWCTPKFTISPPPSGVAPSTLLPAGRPLSRPGSRQQKQQTTDGKEREGQSWRMHATRSLRSGARATCYSPRRSQMKSRRGRMITKLVRQRPE